MISPPQVEASGDGVAPKGLNPQLIAGGFEGDMMFPDGADPARGVAIIGKRQWPNGVIPYDISAITSKHLPVLSSCTVVQGSFFRCTRSTEDHQRYAHSYVRCCYTYCQLSKSYCMCFLPTTSTL